MAKKRRKAKRNTSWKKAEQRVASFFGNYKRTILSGSSAHHRETETNSDTNHPEFFIEIKQRDQHGVWSWYRKAKKDNERESKKLKTKKIVVLALDEVRAKGSIICVHSDNLEAFCRKFLARKKK